MSFEFFQHFRHGEKNGKPFMQFPGFIDSYADEKDHELAFHLGRHAGTNYVCHGTSLFAGTSNLGPCLAHITLPLHSTQRICPREAPRRPRFWRPTARSNVLAEEVCTVWPPIVIGNALTSSSQGAAARPFTPVRPRI